MASFLNLPSRSFAGEIREGEQAVIYQKPASLLALSFLCYDDQEFAEEHCGPPSMSAAPKDKFDLLGFLLLSHLLYFATLVFDLLLLLLQLALRLLILYLPVLQLVANHVASARPKGTTDCRPCTRMTDCGADYRAGAGAQ
jgi:hypothetical protein